MLPGIYHPLHGHCPGPRSPVQGAIRNSCDAVIWLNFSWHISSTARTLSQTEQSCPGSITNSCDTLLFGSMVPGIYRLLHGHCPGQSSIVQVPELIFTWQILSTARTLSWTEQSCPGARANFYLANIVHCTDTVPDRAVLSGWQS
jgi:hypothetical protein